MSTYYPQSRSHKETPHTGGTCAPAIQGGSRVLLLLYRERSANPRWRAGRQRWYCGRRPNSFKCPRLSVTRLHQFWHVTENFRPVVHVSFNLGRTWAFFPVGFRHFPTCGVFFWIFAHRQVWSSSTRACNNLPTIYLRTNLIELHVQSDYIVHSIATLVIPSPKTDIGPRFSFTEGLVQMIFLFNSVVVLVETTQLPPVASRGNQE